MRLSCTSLLIISLLALSVGDAAAKENKDLMKARYYYSHYAYFEAIPYYEKIAEELKDPVIYAQLADCYAVSSNVEKASAAYAKAVSIKGCGNAIVLRYAQLLMQQQQYDEAKKWLVQYQESNKNDKRAANLLAGCNTAASKFLAIPQGTATLLNFNTDGSEFAPTLWNGHLVFASDTAIELKKKTDQWTGRSYYNIYSIPCDGRGNCSGELNKLAETKQVNNKYHDGPCTFSADGKEMYYTRSRFNNSLLSKKTISNKDSTVLLEIMIATNFDTGSRKFRTITPFEYNSKEYSVAHPSVSPNGKWLVFSSTKPKGQGGSDLYMCSRTGGKWSAPKNAGAVINTEGEEVFPYWGDNNTLFFSSDGFPGLGGLDIYRSTWNDNTNSFSPPENIGIPVNSSYDDISLAMYADDRSTYFSSNRPAAKGSDNIYFYKKEKIFLQLNITDAATGLQLAGVSVSYMAADDNKDTTAGDDGRLFTRLYPEHQYAIKVSKPGYTTRQLSVTATSEKETDTLLRNVALAGPTPVKKDTILPMEPTSAPSFAKTIGVPEVNQVYEIGHFYFAFNSAELNDTAKIILDSLCDYLTIRPTMRIEVRAHTDCRGGDAFNLKLSDERALSVVTYLKKKGIQAKRLSSVGFGMRKPKIPCPICEKCTDQQRYLNRVLEFRVLEL